MKKLPRLLARLLAALALLLLVGVVATWEPDRPVSALAARWAPPPSVFLDVAGMKVHLRDQGPRDDPSPVVLLHGTSSSLHTWEGWAQALSGGRRVISLDLPGFGLTGPAPDGDYRIERYVAFMTAVLDALEVRHCVIGGNSFGGWVAWETALALPGRVDKLVLVDASGYPPTATSMPIGFRLARLPVLNRLLEVVLPRSVIASSVRNVFGDPAKVTPALVDRYFDLTLREGNRRALAQRFEQTPSGSGADRIPQLRVPTLILWGGRDRLIAPSDAERFHHDIPGSRVLVFEELGHVPQEEDATRTVAAVKAFLDGG